MPVVMHFATFLKFLTLDVGDKIRHLERYAKPGGFDFYRPSRTGVYDHAAHGRDRAKIVADIEANAATNALEQNLEIFEHTADWLEKQNQTGRISPGRGVWPSPNKIFSVQIEPEIGFETKKGKKILAVYPRKEPRLGRDRAGAGIILLRRAYKGDGSEDFGILDALGSKAYWTPTNVSEAVLDSEVATIEAELKKIF